MNSKVWILSVTAGLCAVGCGKDRKPETEPMIVQVGQGAAGLAAQHLTIGDDGYAVVSLGEAGIEIWSLSVPTNPVVVGKVDSIGSIVKFRRFETTGFAIDRSARLQKFDLSDLTKPREIRTYGLRELSEVARDVMMLRQQELNYLVVGGQFRGVAAFLEREGELVPLKLQHDTPFGLINQMEMHEGRLITSDYQNGLRILDVTAWPKIDTVSELTLGHSITGFKIHENKLWVAALGEGVLIVDIEDMATPSVIGRIALPGLCRDVVTVGTRALVAYNNISGQYGLALLDITDLSQPRIVSTLVTPGTIRSLAYRDGVVYAVDDQAGVLLLKVDGMIQ